ncbi:hypothetical protein E2562_008096 [Oryza meyeriana var. granulata]|uniref:Transposase MuDR plant domain-containing protein n=1 Tax=Oryza meyeriana var. granulata TaxID=110450 RepID=A0A6G1CCZ9_9ORYZ|nr:hypothetical protein E2562_008096 [Oryza meyeriana var. granulata]
MEDDQVLVEPDLTPELEQSLIEPAQELEQNLVEQGLVIGQEFADVHTCRRAVKDMAIAMHFELRVVKSDRSRFIAKCAREGCPWRVHVAKCHGVPTFTVRTLHGEHTCDELRKMLGVNTDKMPVLTILSERQPQVVEAVEVNFPTAFHGFCLRYVNDMVQVQDVMPWFQRFPPNLWAVSYFEGIRYGHCNLGITEILYNWAMECHEFPIVQTVEHIKHQLTCWMLSSP